MKKKLWGGRFQKPTAAGVEEFTASIRFDWRLYRYDIQGSIAHCQALSRAGILNASEKIRIIRALRQIQKEIESGKMQFSRQDEDIHTAIENRLAEKLGKVAGKLRTARSRNDQVALDVRLYLRDQIQLIQKKVRQLREALLFRARQSVDIPMPGYTHLQRAQPILLAHWFLAYTEMFGRDQDRLREVLARVNVLPAGSGALAGVNFRMDRDRMARQLGFERVSQNSLDAVSDRDFIIEFLSGGSLLMMHCSRLTEELILWSSQEFHFLDLPEDFCTGSSLMPQKKNPDVLELIRGKTGRVYGGLFGLLTVMKGLPLAYNRDLQEDKEPLFDGVQTLQDSLAMLTPLLKGLKIRREHLRKAAQDSFLLSTELADYLVEKGVAFRDAHEIVGKIVQDAQKRGVALTDLTLRELRRFSRKIDADIFNYMTLEQSLARKSTIGGTGPQAVRRQIQRLQRQIRSGAGRSGS